MLGNSKYALRNVVCGALLEGKKGKYLIDQKTSNSHNICKVSPKNMNDLVKVKERKCSPQYYKYRLTILHYWIRSLEDLLHIAYNLDFKKSSP